MSERQAIYIAVDNSGSMTTNNRIGFARAALVRSISGITEYLNRGNRVDLALCWWSGGVDHYRVWRDMTLNDVDEALEFVALLNTAASTGTNYEAGTQNAPAFFADTLGEEYTARKLIFLTDGENFGAAGTAPIADILDQNTGSYRTALGTAVDCSAAALSGTTGSASALDNTPADYGQIPNLQNAAEMGAFLLGTILPVDPDRAWPLSVNWDRPVRENLSFRTEIISSRKGQEQRIAQMAFPRGQLSFQSDSKDPAQSRELLQRLHRDQAWYWFIPHPAYAVSTTVDLPSGGSTISVAEEPDWAVPGQIVVLQSPAGDSYLDRIMQTSPIRLAGRTTADMPKGSRMSLGVKARFKKETKLTAVTSQILSQPVTFEIDSDERVLQNIPAAPLKIGSDEFFNKPPNWANGIGHDFEQSREVIDFKRGIVDVRTLLDYSDRMVRARYVGKTFEEVEAMVQFFYRIRGRQKRFYLPLWVDEIRPIGDTLAGQNTLTFFGSGLFDSYASDPAYRRISLSANGGGFVPLGYGISYGDAYGSPYGDGIDNVFDVADIRLDPAGNSVIELTSAIDFDLRKDRLENIHWIVPARMSSDRLTVEWLTSGTARVNLTLKILRE